MIGFKVIDFTLSRSRDGPATFLKGFKQTLLADAYGGYDGVVVGNDITRAGCMAHARWSCAVPPINRKVNGSTLLPEVIAGVIFKDETKIAA